MSGVEARSINPTGTDIFDSLKVVRKKPVDAQPAVKEQTEIKTEDNLAVSNKNTRTDSKTKTNLELVDSPKTQETTILPLMDPNTNKIGKFKVKEDGTPELDKDKNLIFDPSGDRLFILSDSKGEPIPDKNGDFQFVKYEAKTNPDQKDSGKIAPVLGANGKPEKYQVLESGKPVIDAEGNLIPDQKGQFVYLKVDTNQKPLFDEFGEPIFADIKTSNKVPETPIDLTSTNEVSANDPASEDNLNVSPVIDPETNEVRKVKVDENGLPIFNDKNELIDDPNGKTVYVKIDAKGEPVTDAKGDPIFVSPNDVPALATQQNLDKALSSHSAIRVVTGFGWKSTINGGLTTVSNKLIQGVSLKVPFTGGKSFGWGIKQAVVEAVGKEISIAKAVKKGVTVAEATGKATVTATEGAIKTLTQGGALGKGIEPARGLVETMKTGTKDLVKGLFTKGTEATVETTVKATTKASAKTTAKVSSKVSSKATQTVAVKFTEEYGKTAVGIGESVLKKNLVEGLQGGIKSATSRAGKDAAGKIIGKATDKSITTAAEKAALEASSKGTAKAGVTVAKWTHHIGTAANVAIMGYDSYDAYKKIKNPNVSTLSKGLAVTTVALDGVATYYQAKGIGGWKSWVATGASLTTSVLSDYFKDKK